VPDVKPERDLHAGLGRCRGTVRVDRPTAGHPTGSGERKWPMAEPPDMSEHPLETDMASVTK